jgi:hypothetical protein
MKKTNKENPITFFRKANEARQKLVKKSMGGPGSGIGRMAANDIAYDSMMNQTTEPEIDLNLELGDRYKNMAPVVGKAPGVREGFTLEQMSRLNATPIKNKKGGSVNRKKK